MTHDVVVAGTGNAAPRAALAAREGGASVQDRPIRGLYAAVDLGLKAK